MRPSSTPPSPTSAPPAETGREHPLLAGALLGILEKASVDVLTLCEDLEQQELLRSRLTRVEVLRHLLRMADSAQQVPPEVRTGLPEIDWDGWIALGRTLRLPAGSALDDALWFAVRSLVPATAMWLRVYREEQPDRFRMQPG